MVVVLDLDAIVRVIADSARSVQRIFTQGILIPEDGQPPIWTIQDLTTDAWPAIESPVRLPSVNEPRLNLQVLSRENLHSHTIEKPRRVRRNVRGLIRPVIEVVIAEEANIRHEDSRVEVDPMQSVEVISAIGFRNVAVSISEIPLSTRGAGVVARCGGRIHAKLRHDPGANVVKVKIAADAELRQLNFIRPKDLAGTSNRVIFRMVEIGDIVNVGANLRRKEF